MEIVVDGQKQRIPVKMAKKFFGQYQVVVLKNVEKYLKTIVKVEATWALLVHLVGTVWSCVGWL